MLSAVPGLGGSHKAGPFFQAHWSIAGQGCLSLLLGQDSGLSKALSPREKCEDSADRACLGPGRRWVSWFGFF